MTNRNENELNGFADTGNPRTAVARSDKPIQLTTPAAAQAGYSQQPFDIKLHPELPYLKLYAASNPVNTSAGWIVIASIQLLRNNTIVAEFPFEISDPTGSGGPWNGVLSAFVTGTGSPSSDMLLLSDTLTTNLNVGMVPHRAVALADTMRLVVKNLVHCTGLIAFMAAEQSNYHS